ncbi:hypothetical protein vBSauCG_166 [Staphylococcus phage vB_Sau_CG]|nr:hypothetical protein vBSauCG_166 [Staphylococcus phage vB_Sau_CG]
MNELQGVQTLFNKLEGRLEHTAYCGNKQLGYKDILKIQLGLDTIPFDVLYYDELDCYLENPQDFHLYYDDSRVNWIEVWEHLNTVEQELNNRRVLN